MSIKIIGAGLPRTGTNTLKQSLEQLGYKHVYHMKELLVNPDKLHLWKTLDETGDTDWDALYEGYDGTVDFPGYPWYKEHMKRYPDAKVILNGSKKSFLPKDYRETSGIKNSLKSSGKSIWPMLRQVSLKTNYLYMMCAKAGDHSASFWAWRNLLSLFHI